MMDYWGGSLEDFHARIASMFAEAKTISRPASSGPFVYGFTMRFGHDGKPVTEEFGNVSPFGLVGYMEPVTDVIEKFDSVCVVVELPGVGKEDIDLRASVESVFISVDTPFRKYMKDIKLSTRVRPETAAAKFNNGVLEISFKRADDGQAGRKISIQ